MLNLLTSHAFLDAVINLQVTQQHFAHVNFFYFIFLVNNMYNILDNNLGIVGLVVVSPKNPTD